MDRNEKEKVVAELREALIGAPAVVLASSFGMKANDVNNLRTTLRNAGIRYQIVKNTLAKLAIEGTDLEILAPHFKGPTAVVYHPSDPVITAKAVIDFRKTNDKLEVKGGYLTGTLLDAGGVDALSKMPSLDESRAMLLRTIMAVPTGIARVINGVPVQVLNVINARVQQLEG